MTEKKQKTIFLRLLSVLYPSRCPLCDTVVPQIRSVPCKECERKIEYAVQGSRCFRCGKFLLDQDEEYCSDCRRKDHFFSQGYGILPYQGMIRQAVLRFKFHGRKEYASYYGELMARKAIHKIMQWNPQVILPVPMYAPKRRRRGYNQAEILAEELGKLTHIEVRTDLVQRVTATTPQKELSPELRRKNLQKAFTAFEEIKYYERVLLVDDIYTTGSTVDAISNCLRKHGVKKIFILVLCTGTGF